MTDRGLNFIYLLIITYEGYYCLECIISVYYDIINKKDLFARLYMHKKCLKYEKYFSIRNNSFFGDLKIAIKDVLKIFLYFKNSPAEIVNYLNFGHLTIEKIIKKWKKNF